MAANPSLVMRIVSASVAVSNRASNIIRNVLTKGDLGIIEKGKNDLQTEADRSAQRCIVASLHKQFPNVAIFGEEDEIARRTINYVNKPHSGTLSFSVPHWTPSKILEPLDYHQTETLQLDPQEKIPKDFIELGFDEEVLKQSCPEYLKETKPEDVVIWVDPLDGTAEFTQGFLDHVTVLIGISVKGNAVAGVIHQPWFNYEKPGFPLGRCIWGVIGLGSFGFERETPPANKIIVTTSRSHSDRMVTEAVEACNPDEVVRVGGAGHKVLILIEGKVHAYVFASKGCKKWDTCAPEAILHSVGGTLTDFHGIRMNYGAEVQRKNTGGVLATVSNHQHFLGCIPEHIRDCMDRSSEAPPLDFMGVTICGGADLEGAKKDDTPTLDKSPTPNEDTDGKDAKQDNAPVPDKIHTPNGAPGSTPSSDDNPSDSVPNNNATTKL